MPIPLMRTCTVEQGYTEAGETLSHRRVLLTAGVLLLTLDRAAVGQKSAISPDTARAQIRSVLRAYYMHFENRNWDALSPYVLSPKLLERRGAPGQVEAVARDRTRGRGVSRPASAPRTCPAKPSASVDEATIQVDGDWAEVSVPRCSGAAAGVDELRMLYFEERWRFIYTDMFDGSSKP
jgi:hypothetical protein